MQREVLKAKMFMLKNTIQLEFPITRLNLYPGLFSNAAFRIEKSLSTSRNPIINISQQPTKPLVVVLAARK